MNVYTLDPLRDTRWPDFISRHDSASVFHTQPWLDALRRTYGYTPVVYTTSPPSSPLSNGVVLCEINSWLTGRRMVSVPFSDHCEPLLDSPSGAAAIASQLKNGVDEGKWRYVELRPTCGVPSLSGVVNCSTFYLHMLDLRPGLEDLFRCFHKDCVQRKIRRAEREGLVYESGNTEELLKLFHRLMVQTRRRHRLPPQPIQWFRNLAYCLGDQLQIRVAFKDGNAIASIFTVRHKNVIVYKYGSSDSESQNLGGTPFLFWKTIIEAKEAGMTCLDLGRSDVDNHGLIAFKDRLGAKSSTLTYLRWSRNQASDPAQHRSHDVVKQLFAIMPNAVLEATGRMLYRHVG